MSPAHITPTDSAYTTLAELYGPSVFHSVRIPLHDIVMYPITRELLSLLVSSGNALLDLRRLRPQQTLPSCRTEQTTLHLGLGVEPATLRDGSLRTPRMTIPQIR